MGIHSEKYQRNMYMSIQTLSIPSKKKEKKDTSNYGSKHRVEKALFWGYSLLFCCFSRFFKNMRSYENDGLDLLYSLIGSAKEVTQYWNVTYTVARVGKKRILITK